MSAPVVIVLVVVALVSLTAILAVVSQLLARAQRLAADLKDIEQELMPRVASLQHGADVTGREMERLGRAVDELGEQRAR